MWKILKGNKPKPLQSTALPSELQQVNTEKPRIFRPGIEPEAIAWKAIMLPLHHRNKNIKKMVRHDLDIIHYPIYSQRDLNPRPPRN